MPIVAWKPESAPQAIVMKMNGMTGPPTIGPPPWMKSVKAGIWKFGITKAMPMARAPIVPILRKVER